MELDIEVIPYQTRIDPHQQWANSLPSLPPVPVAPPQSNVVSSSPPSFYSRRRSTAAVMRPAGPPPDLPIPRLPPTATTVNQELGQSIAETQFATYTTRSIPSSSFGRPTASPNLSAVAAFSQARQATLTVQNHALPLSPSLDDLSDPPPQSYLQTSSRPSDRFSESQRPQSQSLRNWDRGSLLVPPSEHSHRSEHRPSSRRALTRALELAREAVQLDSTNEDPEAAVQAYAQSVALLSAVMERVRNGEDATDSHRRRRRRSVAAQEEEIRRLQNIHDTYADRMNILSIIYSIPAVPYTAPSLYSATASDTTPSTSHFTTTSSSPPSDNSQQVTPTAYSKQHAQDVPVPPSTDMRRQDPENADAVYLDETVLRGSPRPAPLSTSQHPYSVKYDSVPQMQPISNRSAVALRRARAGSNLPPKAPPPTSSLPLAPIMTDDVPDALLLSKRDDPQFRTAEPDVTRHKTPSGLGALEEENEDINRLDNRIIEDELPPFTHKRESPPLPPLPSSPGLDSIFQPRAVPLTRPPPSGTVMSPRPRGTSLQTRNEINGHSIPSNVVSQRRNPSSARSASPADSIASAGSVPYHMPSVSTMPSSNGFPARSRSSSQPGRRPSIVAGHIQEERPPLPVTALRNGTPRKTSGPSKLANIHHLQLDTILPQNNSLSSSSNLPTTPISPLPPAPPSDTLLKPYHMMNLLRITMTSQTGGYLTRRLHVPFEVWSQGGAKLTNVDEKIRVVNIICGALEDLQNTSYDCFGAGNVSSGLALGIGSIGRKEAEIWQSKLEEISTICMGVVSSFGKKLGVGEGFATRKITLGDKITRGLDKFTNGKNLDSPSSYVQGLKKLFQLTQLLDEHTRAVIVQPTSQLYSAFPTELRSSTEQKLKRLSEFFASVVLTFVIRDLSQLLDKYVKKCEKWLEE